MPTNNPRFCITVTQDILDEIDNYRFGKRFNSRSQATVELIRIGIKTLKQKEQSNMEESNISRHR